MNNLVCQAPLLMIAVIAKGDTLKKFMFISFFIVVVNEYVSSLICIAYQFNPIIISYSYGDNKSDIVKHNCFRSYQQ